MTTAQLVAFNLTLLAALAAPGPALLQPDLQARLFGVPRWAMRAVPEHCFRAVAKLASGDRTSAFDELMNAALALGRIQGARGSAPQRR